MFRSVFNIAAGGLSANRLRINTIASNIANAQTTRTAEGGPYKRRDVVFMADDIQASDGFASALDKASLKSVRASEIVKDDRPPQLIYDPKHPDADKDTGMVAMPNINTVEEMANMITASTAYKASAEVLSMTKDLSLALRRLAQRT